MNVYGDTTEPLLRYDPPLDLLIDIEAVECWLRWCQHPEGGRMAFDFALDGREYVDVETGERSFSDAVADGFDAARDAAARIIHEEDDDRDLDLVLIECMADTEE